MLKRSQTAKIKFKDAFEEYIKLIEGNKDLFYLESNIDKERLSLLQNTYPFLKDAYSILGIEEIRRLNYNQTNIKKQLINQSDRSYENKIARILSKDGFTCNN